MAIDDSMSHSEIWDDSALVDSWNDALEEYEKYHSMKARGDGISGLLRPVDDVNPIGEKMDPEDMETGSPVVGARAKETVVEEPLSQDKYASGIRAEAQSQNHDKIYTQETDQKQPALPEHLIGQVHDQGLKNLLMSWYYAGYYTGLYEGQQHGSTTRQNTKNGT